MKDRDFEKRFEHYEIYTLTLCLSYHYEKQTSRIQSLIISVNFVSVIRYLAISSWNSLSRASLGSSLIFGLFLMFLARFAYLHIQKKYLGEHVHRVRFIVNILNEIHWTEAIKLR